MTVTEDLFQILNSLADRFCERRAYRCLYYFLPALLSPNGLTDGREECRNAVRSTRAFCRNELREDEAEDLHRANNLLDRMLHPNG